MPSILVVYGTRPEAIKMAPVIKSLLADPEMTPVVAVTGQHRSMLDQVNLLFGIDPSFDLDIFAAKQTLEDVTTRILKRLAPVIEQVQPDLLLVQGDTTTTFATALSSFYHRVPVVHLEAGLRTWNPYDPYPEEINRRLTSQLSALHLAPTRASRANLERENVDPESITVTGNTVIDALHHVVSVNSPLETPGLMPLLEDKFILVTTHRRESWGVPMERTARAIARLAGSFPSVRFLIPAHLNPRVRDVLVPQLSHLPSVSIVDPLPYSDFARAMQSCYLVLTDSGGVQEEAPSLGKPVVLLRDTTERPEAVEAGTVVLVGTAEDEIVKQVSLLLEDPGLYAKMSTASNPYGDGYASGRAVQAIKHFLGLAVRPKDFDGRSASSSTA